MTGEQCEAVVRMWREGVAGREIADRLGVTYGAVNAFVSTHRDMCPKRRPHMRAVKRPGYGDISSLYGGGLWEV